MIFFFFSFLAISFTIFGDISTDYFHISAALSALTTITGTITEKKTIQYLFIVTAIAALIATTTTAYS